jgi:D-alanyl-D-alanine carboxypeptidase
MFQATPGDNGRQLLELPLVDGEGLPITLEVLSRETRSEQPWARVRYGGQRGWIPGAATVPVDPQPLDPSLRSRLDALLRAAGGRSGMQVAESGGAPLFARAEQTPRILASNAKLFVTAAALARLGDRVRSLVPRILLPSNNVLADGLLVRLGRDAREGVRLTEAFAGELGARVRLADGSGLDRRDRAAPREVVRFLVGMRRHERYADWFTALPVAGRSGTLAGRMGGTPAAGACQAKTGTLRDVSTLSGYCTARSGRRVVFSILMNGLSPARGRWLQDQMLAALVRGA